MPLILNYKDELMFEINLFVSAYENGREGAALGCDVEDNPYNNSERNEWINGFLDYYTEKDSYERAIDNGK